MALIYKFKKEKLNNGQYVSRPKILVEIHGRESSFTIFALVDSGCDVTVIPEDIARALGIEIKEEKEKIYAFREVSDVVQSSAKITFIGRGGRESVTIIIPVLVVLSEGKTADDPEIVLGLAGIFDMFEITFKKSQNKIILKKVHAIK